MLVFSDFSVFCVSLYILSPFQIITYDVSPALPTTDRFYRNINHQTLRKVIFSQYSVWRDVIILLLFLCLRSSYLVRKFLRPMFLFCHSISIDKMKPRLYYLIKTVGNLWPLIQVKHLLISCLYTSRSWC